MLLQEISTSKSRHWSSWEEGQEGKMMGEMGVNRKKPLAQITSSSAAFGVTGR